MAKITLNPIFDDAHGKFDGHVLRRTADGGLSITKLPDMSKVKWSDAQTAHRQRFKEAVARARQALADPQVRAEYERRAAILDKRPFDLAVSEFMKNIPQPDVASDPE